METEKLEALLKAATPGPWRVGTIGLTNDGQRPILAEETRIGLADSQSDFKRGSGWKHECETREVNAALIAAAPDLAAEVLRLRAENAQLVAANQALVAANADLEAFKAEALKRIEAMAFDLEKARNGK